jgi:hypothetical protein
MHGSFFMHVGKILLSYTLFLCEISNFFQKTNDGKTEDKSRNVQFHIWFLTGLISWKKLQ